GAAPTTATSAVEPAASTRYAQPPAWAAIQRRPGSGSASGEATIAAVIAARLIAWPPAVAPASVPSPVTVLDSRHGTLKPKVASTATPGTFCEAIVTT